MVTQSIQTAPSPVQPLAGTFPVVELRQYTLHEGQRDRLVELFEREFIESQEAAGMKVIGTFRDLDRPDRFVWLRGFADMDSRLAGLSEFYGGATWEVHREEANATMIDSDNVLLLRAPGTAAQFHLNSPRPSVGEQVDAGLVVASILYLNSEPAEAAEIFAAEVKPRLEHAGIAPLAWFVPETSANNFPRLPVRKREKVLVWLAGFAGTAEFDSLAGAIADASAPLERLLGCRPEVLRLEPTPRSQLRGLPWRGTPNDFDFLVGRWLVSHRKLAARGIGSSDWRTFSGHAETRALLGGIGNVEEHRIEGSESGVATRFFDRSAGLWAIYWVSDRDGKLQPPVHGAFRGDVGLFEGEEEDAGRRVKVRFAWRRLTPDSARWEQAFSYDQGRSWETNWVMEFERAAA